MLACVYCMCLTLLNEENVKEKWRTKDKARGLFSDGLKADRSWADWHCTLWWMICTNSLAAELNTLCVTFAILVNDIQSLSALNICFFFHHVFSFVSFLVNS